MTKKEKQQKLIRYLFLHPCKECGEKDIATLDFHHIIPATKYKAISTLLRENAEWNIIEDEIKKTEIRCANCHRKITAKDNNWAKYIEDYNSQIDEEFILED